MATTLCGKRITIQKTKNAKKRLSVSKALQSRLGKDSPLQNIIETGLYENITKGLTKGSRRKITKKKKHKRRKRPYRSY